MTWRATGRGGLRGPCPSPHRGAWCQPGSVLSRTQEDRSHRGDPQTHRGRAPVPGQVLGLDPAQVAHTGAAVVLGVGVEDLLPVPGEGQAHPVALVRGAGEVDDADHQVGPPVGIGPLTQVGQDVVVAVAGLDPLESSVGG